jgi:hypothetical protein
MHGILKKLRREATANPKKAAILGLLSLAALYFWAPLLRQWTAPERNAASSGSASPAVPVASAAPMAGALATPPVAAAAPAPASLHWRELAAAIDSDPRMQPVKPKHDSNAARDPFVAPKAEVVQERGPETGELADAGKTPDDLGVFLSSTIVGAARRTAVVNGKVYGPGRELHADDGVVFVVKQIEPWGIVLERAGRRFELELPKPSP